MCGAPSKFMCGCQPCDVVPRSTAPLPETGTNNAAGQAATSRTAASIAEGHPETPAPAAPLTGDTPRTDAFQHNGGDTFDDACNFARQLERELADTVARLGRFALESAKRGEELAAVRSARPEFYCAAGGCVEQCVNCADEQPASIPQVRSTTQPPMVQIGWAKLKTRDGLTCLEGWRDVDEGPSEHKRHALYVIDPAFVPSATAPLYSPEIIVRNNADGTLDEAIVKDGKAHFHLEQMSATHWWMALNLDKQCIHIGLHSNAKIKANVSDEGEVHLLSAAMDGGSKG